MCLDPTRPTRVSSRATYFSLANLYWRAEKGVLYVTLYGAQRTQVASSTPYLVYHASQCILYDNAIVELWIRQLAFDSFVFIAALRCRLRLEIDIFLNC